MHPSDTREIDEFKSLPGYQISAILDRHSPNRTPGTRLDSVPGVLPVTEEVNNIVKVFSKPNCKQCDMTYKVLDSRGIKYEVTDITEDDTAYSYVKDELGYMQAPVVVAGDQHWSGFRPDLINNI
jgi:glutaredoxin-like protein NrdH